MRVIVREDSQTSNSIRDIIIQRLKRALSEIRNQQKFSLYITPNCTENARLIRTKNLSPMRSLNRLVTSSMSDDRCSSSNRKFSTNRRSRLRLNQNLTKFRARMESRVTLGATGLKGRQCSLTLPNACVIPRREVVPGRITPPLYRGAQNRDHDDDPSDKYTLENACNSLA